MKSANLSLFAVVGVACLMAVSGSVACGVSGDGLGNATDPSSINVGEGAANGSGMNSGMGGSPGQGGQSQSAAGGNTATGGNTMMGGGKGGSPANTGGVMAGGNGGMRTGGAGGLQTGGMNTAGAGGMGGMLMGGSGGMLMGGSGGTGGMGGAGGMGGTIGLVHNTSPTPGEIKCGSDECNDGDYCCITNGQTKCLSRAKDCPQGSSYRGCDDQKDCAANMVCCGAMLQNSFNTACVLAFQCMPPEVVVCANATQCSDGRFCCARPVANMTMGVCQHSCQ